MGKIDHARGDERTRVRRRLAVLIALAVAGAALVVGVLVQRGSGPDDAGPPASGIPTTSEPVSESALPTQRPSSLPPTSGAPSTRPTSGPPPSSRQPTSRERYEEIARRELEQGLVAYNPPAQARVQEDFEVTVRVQRGTATVSPSLTSLPGTAPVIVEKLPVGTYMRAELRGSGFDVAALSEELQLIDGVSEWAWRVTPQTDGLRTLRLTLVVELDSLPLSNRTFDRAINVVVEQQPPWYQRAFGLLDVSGVVTAVAIAAILGSAKLGRMWWVRRKATADPGGDDLGGEGAGSGSTDAAPDAPGPASDVPTATTTAAPAPTATADGNKPNP